MLNPIDTAAVIRDGGAVGRFPGQLHEGVAWWLGASFITVTAASQLVVASDGQPATAEFLRRLCKGAINAHHYACKVTAISGGISEEAFLTHLRREHLRGAYLTTTATSDGAQLVEIRLYTDGGQLLHDDTGLTSIRNMINEDHVPIPVSESARGTILVVPAHTLEDAR